MNANPLRGSRLLIVLAPALAIAIGACFVAAVADPKTDQTFRRILELTVSGLQVGGVLALIVSKLEPASALANAVLIGAQVGLGVAGSLCAVYRSDFTLFAGATLGALLTVATWCETRHLDSGVTIATES
jgi:hypothetical protein